MQLIAMDSPDDREYIEKIYIEYLPLMYRTAMKYTANRQDAENVIHDAMIRLIEKVDTLRKIDCCTLPAYLVITIRNTSINLIKSRQVQQQHLDKCDIQDYADTLGDAKVNVENMVLRNEEAGMFYKIWAELDTKDRNLLERKYILCQSDTEIAKVLHIKPASVRMKLTRARRAAAVLMQKEGKRFGYEKE